MSAYASPPRVSPVTRALRPVDPAYVEWDFCQRCRVWDFCFRGICAPCFREVHTVTVRRTWGAEIARDWDLRWSPWVMRQYASVADPRHWPAPMLLLAFVVLVGREFGRLG